MESYSAPHQPQIQSFCLLPPPSRDAQPKSVLVFHCFGGDGRKFCAARTHLKIYGGGGAQFAFYLRTVLVECGQRNINSNIVQQHLCGTCILFVYCIASLPAYTAALLTALLFVGKKVIILGFLILFENKGLGWRGCGVLHIATEKGTMKMRVGSGLDIRTNYLFRVWDGMQSK